MDWPTATVIATGMICGTAIYLATKIAEALEPGEYIDKLDPEDFRYDPNELTAVPIDPGEAW